MIYDMEKVQMEKLKRVCSPYKGDKREYLENACAI